MVFDKFKYITNFCQHFSPNANLKLVALVTEKSCRVDFNFGKGTILRTK